MPVTYTVQLSDASPLMRILVARILPAVFIVVGAGMAYSGVQEALQARASTDWPTVEGRVLASDVESRRTRSSSSTSTGTGSTVYEAEVLFEYSVEGMTYKGNRVAYSSFATNSPHRAQTIVNRYPEGATVDVFYMPGNPAESLLEPGTGAASAILPVMGLGLLFVGIMTAVLLTITFRKVDQMKASSPTAVPVRGPRSETSVG